MHKAGFKGFRDLSVVPGVPCVCVSVRLAVCRRKSGKPSVLITKTFEIYLGNPTDEEMLVQSCDLTGFYTRAFEIKIVKSTLGNSENEVSVSSLKHFHNETLEISGQTI